MLGLAYLWVGEANGGQIQIFATLNPIIKDVGASARLYQIFELGLLQLYPWDYWGDLLFRDAMGEAKRV